MITAPNTVMRKVSSMFVECSLQIVNFDRGGVAMSDCCRGHAVSAVEMSNGMRMWRCRDHEGVRNARTGETGPVHVEVLVKKGH